MIHAISEYASDDPRVAVVLSYKHPPGYNLNAKLLSDISSIGYENYWSRKSAFSSLEPDWEKVQMVGSETNADWAVFIRTNIAHSKPTIVDTYFYKFATEEVTVKTAKSSKDAIAAAATRMIKEFFAL